MFGWRAIINVAQACISEKRFDIDSGRITAQSSTNFFDRSFVGYTATEAFANIIPASVHVRLNCKTVASKDANEIIHFVKQHITQHCPRGATITFKDFESYSEPIKFPSIGAAFQMAYDALSNVYKKPPLLTAMGGSIRALTDIKDVLGIYTYSFGFQQADEIFMRPINLFVYRISKRQEAVFLLLKHIAHEW